MTGGKMLGLTRSAARYRRLQRWVRIFHACGNAAIQRTPDGVVRINKATKDFLSSLAKTLQVGEQVRRLHHPERPIQMRTGLFPRKSTGERLISFSIHIYIGNVQLHIVTTIWVGEHTDRNFFSFAVICGFLTFPEGIDFCDFAGGGALELAGFGAATGGGVSDCGALGTA